MHIPLGADTIPKLTAELSNPDPRVRSIIAQTLGKQGTNAATAIPVLLSLTNDSDRYVQESATVALKQIGYRLSPSK